MRGTSNRRRDAQAPERADGLAELVLPDHDGEPVRLGDLWCDEPVALVWLRHYG